MDKRSETNLLKINIPIRFFIEHLLQDAPSDKTSW